MKFRCETCDLSFQSAYSMREHFKSLSHREKADFSIVDAALNKFGEVVSKQEKLLKESKDDESNKV